MTTKIKKIEQTKQSRAQRIYQNDKLTIRAQFGYVLFGSSEYYLDEVTFDCSGVEGFNQALQEAIDTASARLCNKLHTEKLSSRVKLIFFRDITVVNTTRGYSASFVQTNKSSDYMGRMPDNTFTNFLKLNNDERQDD